MRSIAHASRFRVQLLPSPARWFPNGTASDEVEDHESTPRSPGQTAVTDDKSRLRYALFVLADLPLNRPLAPSLSPSDGERVPEGRVRGWFMVPMRDAGIVGALHETPHPFPLLQWGRGCPKCG